MNPCNVKPFLTAYVLGDLEPKKAQAIQTHLASCPACREQAEALQKTLSLVKMAFPAEQPQTEKAPVLDPARRMKLLSIKPVVKQNRFLLFIEKAYRPMRSIAATLLCVFGILAILSAAMFPAMSGAMLKAKSSPRARDGKYLKGERASRYELSDTLSAPSEPMPEQVAQMPEKTLEFNTGWASARSYVEAKDEQLQAVGRSAKLEKKKSRASEVSDFKHNEEVVLDEVREKEVSGPNVYSGTTTTSAGTLSLSDGFKNESHRDRYDDGLEVAPIVTPPSASTPEPMSPQPQPVDAVIITKSPVILKNISGSSRMSGKAGATSSLEQEEPAEDSSEAIRPSAEAVATDAPGLIRSEATPVENQKREGAIGGAYYHRENSRAYILPPATPAPQPSQPARGRAIIKDRVEDAESRSRSSFGDDSFKVPNKPASGKGFAYHAGVGDEKAKDGADADGDLKQLAVKEDSSGMEALRINIPKATFTGTPKDIRSANLEEPGARREQMFYGVMSDTPKMPSPQKKAERQEESKKVLDQSKVGAGMLVASETEVNGRFKEGVKDKLADGDSSVQVINGTTVISEMVTLEKMGLKADLSKVGACRIVLGNDRGEIERKPAKPREPLPFNPFVMTTAEQFSTFAMDVDTASYTLTRQSLRSGKLPDPERVRLEEIVNAFDYGDKASDKATFRIYQDGAQSQFGAGYNLLRIGVKGRRLGREEQRPAMLTMVLDVSGSMSQPDRIGFARLSLSSLLDQMGADDRIQLIAYSDQAQFVIEPTPSKEKKKIMDAFDRLQCNGSTNLEEGLRRAYEQAVQAFIPGAENRVILISDGVANLGADSAQEILDKVAANRKQGITCSVFGVGAGTYNDQMLEGLANKGDGVYRFLDSAEAVKTAFVDDLAATLNTIAKDAKIQVEWNPKTVRRYRQMGYENRKLTKEQFRDDTVDAGEVGSGQSVTALYELELMPNVTAESNIGTVRIRYQRADNGKVEEISAPLLAATVLKPAHKATPAFKVAASAAEFAELLRNSPNAQGGNFEAVADYLRPAALEMTLDTRVKELLELVTTATALSK